MLSLFYGPRRGHPVRGRLPWQDSIVYIYIYIYIFILMLGLPSGIIRKNWNDTEMINMAPAQGWHAQSEKGKQLWYTYTVLSLFSLLFDSKSETGRQIPSKNEETKKENNKHNESVFCYLRFDARRRKVKPLSILINSYIV